MLSLEVSNIFDGVHGGFAAMNPNADFVQHWDYNIQYHLYIVGILDFFFWSIPLRHPEDFIVRTFILCGS